MSKLQEYFEKKRIERLGLPKIWVVKSTREGVDVPIECQVKQIDNVSNYKRHIISESPYEIDIENGKVESINEGFGTGFGDLWAWTYYSTLSKEDADKYYLTELDRVTNKYLS